jgi:thiamine-phosphate pyrophosphorylase
MSARCLLYYITDRTAFPGDERTRRRCLLEKIAEAARAGVDYIQLREKNSPARELESLAREAISIIDEQKTANRAPKTALLINSRTDVALAACADGVHLRSDDISPQEIRNIWEFAAQPDLCGAGTHAREISPGVPFIGISCHSPEKVAQAAADGASFAVFAPVFEKKDATAAQPTGLAMLELACRANIPVLALGGVTFSNARSCLEAGAAGVAGIRLFQENDIAQVVKQLRLDS